MVAPLVAAAGAQAALSAGQAIAQALARPQGHWEQERVGKSLVTVRRGVHPSAAGIAAVLIGTAAVGGVVVAARVFGVAGKYTGVSTADRQVVGAGGPLGLGLLPLAGRLLWGR